MHAPSLSISALCVYTISISANVISRARFDLFVRLRDGQGTKACAPRAYIGGEDVTHQIWLMTNHESLRRPAPAAPPLHDIYRAAQYQFIFAKGK